MMAFVDTKTNNCPQRGIVDTQDQELQVRVPGRKQRRRTIEERREIVEETLVAGASVSRVARRHDVNANQVFYWRKLYREGQLGGDRTTQLLPVKVRDDRTAKAVESDGLAVRLGTMEIKLPKGTLRISGAVDVVALRAVLECLVG
jgi:transposase